MTFRRCTVSVVCALFLGGSPICVANTQQTSGPVKAVQLTGLAGVKDNNTGSLSAQDGSLHFIHGKASSDVNAASIQDVVIGSDSRKSIGNPAGMISIAAPYGAGRFLSLFRTKIDTLTIQYRDSDGGLHGAIFTMPAGTADAIKTHLLAQSPNASYTGHQTVTAVSGSASRSRRLICRQTTQRFCRLNAEGICFSSRGARVSSANYVFDEGSYERRQTFRLRKS